MKQLIIQTKLLGRRGPILAPISLEVPNACLTVQELIACIVRQQVEAFRERQEASQFVSVLTERQLTSGLETGKFASGGSDLKQAVDVERAIDAACTAFADGFFYVFLQNNQVMRLDESIELGETTEALFVRLTPLAGG